MSLIRGIAAIILISAGTVILCLPLYALALIRALLPSRLREQINNQMDTIVDYWIKFNRLVIHLLGISRVNVMWHGNGELSRERWYLVVANHQSWTDILILQILLLERIPSLRFFAKQELIWVPFVGLAMWCLGFPYLRRKQAEGGISDRERIQTAAMKYRNRPSSALNFLEGTRFTPTKQHSQNSRFSHLLNPKIGGIGYLLGAMKGHLTELIDVSIHYPTGAPTFWQFLQGHCPDVQVQVDVVPIPAVIQQEGETEQGRTELAAWIENLWSQKNQWLIDRADSRAVA